MDIDRNKSLDLDLGSIVMDAFPLAYVRCVQTDSGAKNYAVYSGDGTQLATFPTRDEAFFAARQHDLEPVSSH